MSAQDNGTHPRILVAARHDVVRTGVTAALAAAGLEIVAECRDAADVLAAVRRARPDVCLIDVDLPGGGLSAAESIASRAKAPRIVMLGSAHDEPPLFAALRAGVSGYLLEDVDAVRLAADVSAVAAGKGALAPELAARLIDEFRSRRTRLACGAEGLTEREAEVLDALADGLTTKEAANRLGLSATTVRRHVSLAAKRLGVADRQAAVDRFTAFKRGERK